MSAILLEELVRDETSLGILEIDLLDLPSKLFCGVRGPSRPPASWSSSFPAAVLGLLPGLLPGLLLDLEGLEELERTLIC